MAALAAGKGPIGLMVECSGIEKALHAGLEAVEPPGTIVQLGLGDAVALPPDMIAKEIALVGAKRLRNGG